MTEQTGGSKFRQHLTFKLKNMENKIVTSKQYTLNGRDFLKGLLVSVISAALTVIIESYQSESMKFDWRSIGMVSLIAGLGYLIKNWATPSQTITPTAKT